MIRRIFRTASVLLISSLPAQADQGLSLADILPQLLPSESGFDEEQITKMLNELPTDVAMKAYEIYTAMQCPGNNGALDIRQTGDNFIKSAAQKFRQHLYGNPEIEFDPASQIECPSQKEALGLLLGGQIHIAQCDHTGERILYFIREKGQVGREASIAAPTCDITH